MHRHGFKKAKLGRKTNPRKALIRGLAVSLIENESLTTTHAKAKTVVPFVEKLIGKAKKNDLHNRRQIIAKLNNVAASHKLVDRIAPQIKDRRPSGYLRLTRLDRFRKGDNAPLSKVSFVDDLAAKEAEATPVKQIKPTAKKPVAKKPQAAKAKPAVKSKKETKK